MATRPTSPSIETVVVDLWRSLFAELTAALRRTAVKVAKTAPLLGLLAMSFPTAGSALGTAEERSACIPDAFRLCSSEIPNADRVIACLKVEKAKLSDACRTVMKRNGSI